MLIKDGCTYDVGEWGACNPRGMATRVDLLTANSNKYCYVSKTKTKFCATQESEYTQIMLDLFKHIKFLKSVAYRRFVINLRLIRYVRNLMFTLA